MKVGIIGMGWVGSSIAISTIHTNLATELLLNDARPGLAEGEAMDLQHGAAFAASTRVEAAAIEDMRDADAVVVTAGKNGKPGQSRLELLRENAAIVTDIARRLRGFPGVLIMVTNPVDVLTLVATEASGLPPERVIGTGTMLDTARLREIIAAELRLHPRSVHAQVIGEHGDSKVALWSSAVVGGRSLRRFPGWQRDLEQRMDEQVRCAAYEIIQRKGATNHAIGLVTAHLLKWMLRGERRIITVSRVHDGPLGIQGVALSLPMVVSSEGATEVIEPELDEQERAALERSADILQSAYKNLKATSS